MKHKWWSLLLGVSLMSLMPLAFAEGEAAQDLTEIADNVIGIFPSFITLVVAICYLAGMAFAAAGVMKFKQHKDNPTQVPLNGPIALVFIAAALIYLPTLLTSTGTSVFGTAEEGAVGGASGQDPFASGGASG